MPSADFCRPVRMDHSNLSSESETDYRSPEVSSTPFGAQPRGLQPVPLMDMDFAVICPVVQHASLIPGSCTSAHAFALRFFQTPPRDAALALRYDFTYNIYSI